MADPFQHHAPSLTSPATHAEPIVPNDSQSLAIATRAVYVGGGGDMRVRMLSGETVTFTGLQAGQFYPLRIVRVLATGTTATGLMGLS